MSREQMEGAMVARWSGRAAMWGMALAMMLACVALVGCRNIPPPDNAIKDPHLLMAAVDGRLEQIESARFKEVVFEYYGEERVKVRQLILVKSPDKLRVQTRLPGSDEIINLLVSDGEQFAMHRRDTNEYLVGAPTRQNVNRLMQLDLSAQDVVRVMLGGAPWDRMAREKGPLELSWDKKRGFYLLETATHRGGSFQVLIRHTDFAVVEVEELDAEGESRYHYTTRDWERHGSVSLPDWRRFEWPGENVDFSVDVGETQLDVELNDMLFQLSPPPGSRIIRLDGNG